MQPFFEKCNLLKRHSSRFFKNQCRRHPSWTYFADFISGFTSFLRWPDERQPFSTRYLSWWHNNFLLSWQLISKLFFHKLTVKKKMNCVTFNASRTKMLSYIVWKKVLLSVNMVDTDVQESNSLHIHWQTFTTDRKGNDYIE